MLYHLAAIKFGHCEALPGSSTIECVSRAFFINENDKTEGARFYRCNNLYIERGTLEDIFHVERPHDPDNVDGMSAEEIILLYLENVAPFA